MALHRWDIPGAQIVWNPCDLLTVEVQVLWMRAAQYLNYKARKCDLET